MFVHQCMLMCVHQQFPDTTCCLTGAGTEAFCSGGDQSVRGKGGYVGADGVPRLNVLDLQVGSFACRHVSVMRTIQSIGDSLMYDLCMTDS